jgi:hypothetical protein
MKHITKSLYNARHCHVTRSFAYHFIRIAYYSVGLIHSARMCLYVAGGHFEQFM